MGLHKTPKRLPLRHRSVLTFAAITSSSPKMRTIAALLVVACCLSSSNATLRLLKSKLSASPLLQKAVEYLAAPEPLPAIPASYARPAYATHVSTFSVAVPSVAASVGVAPVGVPSVGVAPLGVPSGGVAPLGVAPVGVPSIGVASVGVPSVGVASVGVPSVTAAATLALPQHLHETTFTGPAVVYPEPLGLPAPHLHYHGPEGVIIDPFVARILEEHFRGHYGGPLPLNNQIGNW